MKGNYNEECNITSCQKPNSATWFNHFNQRYYCADCAYRLNNDEFNKRSALENLGHNMCTEIEQNKIKPISIGLGGSRLDYLLHKASLHKHEPPIIVAQEEKGISINNLFKNLDTGEITSTIPEDVMFTITKQTFDEDFKSGKEKRRERRARERKNKKL